MKNFPTIFVQADTLAEGFHKAVIDCYDQGLRIHTPKHRPGLPLGYDANIIVNIDSPEKDPQIHMAGLIEDPRGLVQYILEVTHGIHDHWKKNPDDPNDTKWGYTYHERFINQIPFILARIKQDFQEKGRATGRDYFFSTWRPEEDNILTQKDPPCFQNGQFRLTPSLDGKDVLYLHYLTYWRSRDLAKAFNENNIAQIRMQRLMAEKISNMLEREVRVGSYIDQNASLHIYGAYIPENFDRTVQRMKEQGLKRFGMSLQDFLSIGGGEEKLKRLVAAQMAAEKDGHGKNIPKNLLNNLGYDTDNFAYPKDWGTWPKEWDATPDVGSLRV